MVKHATLIVLLMLQISIIYGELTNCTYSRQNCKDCSILDHVCWCPVIYQSVNLSRSFYKPCNPKSDSQLIATGGYMIYDFVVAKTMTITCENGESICSFGAKFSNFTQFKNVINSWYSDKRNDVTNRGDRKYTYPNFMQYQCDLASQCQNEFIKYTNQLSPVKEKIKEISKNLLNFSSGINSTHQSLVNLHKMVNSTCRPCDIGNISALFEKQAQPYFNFSQQLEYHYELKNSNERVVNDADTPDFNKIICQLHKNSPWINIAILVLQIIIIILLVLILVTVRKSGSRKEEFKELICLSDLKSTPVAQDNNEVGFEEENDLYGKF